MHMRGEVRGFLLEFVHEIGVYVHSCVIQDIIVHNLVQRYIMQKNNQVHMP